MPTQHRKENEWAKSRTKASRYTALIAALFAVLLACTPAIAMADMVGIDVSGWQAANVTCTASYDFAVVKVSPRASASRTPVGARRPSA